MQQLPCRYNRRINDRKQSMTGKVNDFGAVCAVIVTYNIGTDFTTNLASTLQQVEHCVIVDNSDDATSWPLLEALKQKYDAQLTIIKSPQNSLAVAQNIGINHVLKFHYAWVLLLDDDSSPEPGMIKAFATIYPTLPNPKTIGILAPNIHDARVSAPHRFMRLKHNYGFERVTLTQPYLDDVLYVCASGSLIPTSLFKQVGMMDESYFIYLVDTEFCLRLREQGYRIIAVRDAVLNHELGKRTTHQMLGMKVTTTNHSPEARYYQYRNRLRLWKQYGLRYPGYIVFDYLRMNYEIFRIVFFERQTIAKLKQILLGLWDGLGDVVGPRPMR